MKEIALALLVLLSGCVSETPSEDALSADVQETGTIEERETQIGAETGTQETPETTGETTDESEAAPETEGQPQAEEEQSEEKTLDEFFLERGMDLGYDSEKSVQELDAVRRLGG